MIVIAGEYEELLGCSLFNPNRTGVEVAGVATVDEALALLATRDAAEVVFTHAAGIDDLSKLCEVSQARSDLDIVVIRPTPETVGFGAVRPGDLSSLAARADDPDLH
jgi:hypothetical protein